MNLLIVTNFLLITVLVCSAKYGDEEFTVRCLTRERKALLKFKEGLVDEHGMTSSWGKENECCKWEGVECSNTTGRVIALQLAGQYRSTGYYYLGVCSVEYNNGDAIRCIPKEREALLEFSKSFRCRTSRRLFEPLWETTEIECCKWNGVQCSNTTGHVIALEMFPGTNSICVMSPEVSSSLLSLHNLKVLEFTAIILPNRFLEIIGSMTQLQHLNFSGSRFVGILPSQLWNLTNLRSLDLSNTRLVGTIPPQIGNLVFLETLDLSNNYFFGIIPTEIGNLIRLETVNLTRNQFNGTIPSEIGNLTNLGSLDLSQNQFFGTLPSEIGCLTNLGSLHLSQNQFSKTLPRRVWNLTNLKSLDLSQNQFFGTLPSEIGYLTNLVSLDLSNNHFSETLPRRVWNLTNLKSLDLSQNQFFGNLPSEIGNLIKLQTLNLSHNQFLGTLPSEIGNLTNLRTLDLTNNYFSGSLPPQVWNITDLETLDLSKNNLTSTTIGSLFNMTTNHVAPNLRKLNLGSNNLKVLPPHLRQLSTLEELDVSFNYMKATVTEADLINLPNLKRLELSFNSLTLDISPDWTPPFQLNVIGLSGCNLGPHFPSWIRTQITITWLDLSLNNISGEIPKWLSSFSHEVLYLNLSQNQLNGTISEFSTIQIIDVSSNMFSGPMPYFSPSTWIFQISKNMFSGSISFECSSQYSLSVLDLSNNQLSGNLPNCWRNWDTLWILNLANNSFYGEIPYDFGYLLNLKKLHLANNNLSGELPSTLQNCKLLQFIDIGDNMLTGSIPTWIGEYHETMAYLTLRNNRFHGSIPPQICYLSHIQLLDLSQNNLSGKIPPCFNNFTYMVNISSHYIPPVFNFSDRVAMFNEYTIVIWKRNLAEYGRKNIILLKLIDLSLNGLVGNIPRSFSSLKGLQSLNLSGNRLTGTIDPDIGQMSSLDSLDLSRNHLSGVIPISMAKLYSLGVLDFSNNNLSGVIPTGGNLHTFTESAYGGNIGLCGNPLPPCSRDRPDIYSTNNKTQNVDDNGGILSLSFLKEIGISVILGFIFGFWGVVGSLIVKESWRRVFYNFCNDVEDWLYVRVSIFWAKLRIRSSAKINI